MRKYGLAIAVSLLALVGYTVAVSKSKADVFYSSATPVQATDRIQKTDTHFNWTARAITISYVEQNPVATLGGGSRTVAFADLPPVGQTAVANIADLTDRFLAGRVAAPNYTPPAPAGTIVP